MAALDHIIVFVKDKEVTAQFFADIIGLERRPDWRRFSPVITSNGVSLDFANANNPPWLHLAFIVSDQEFDAAMTRIHDAGIMYFAELDKTKPGQINHYWNGRGVYFEDPTGLWLEMMTVHYGDPSELDPICSDQEFSG